MSDQPGDPVIPQGGTGEPWGWSDVGVTVRCGRMLTGLERCPNPPERVHLVYAYEAPFDLGSEARQVVLPLCTDHDWGD